MDDLQHRRALVALGQRAIDYYVDTGLCVFCDADDCAGRPHEDHCNVGELSCVEVDEERMIAKALERDIVDAAIGRELAEKETGERDE